MARPSTRVRPIRVEVRRRRPAAGARRQAPRRRVGTRRINKLSGVGRNAIRYLGITRAGRAEPSQRILRTTAERLLAVPIPAAPLELLAPSSVIDATGTIRRLRALVAAGHSQRSIADRLGVSQSALCDLMHRTHCTVRNRDLVAALFAELEHQPGTNDRARQRGVQLGWALPLEWDEDTIDDPSAEPVRARRGGPIDTERTAVRLQRSPPRACRRKPSPRSSAYTTHRRAIPGGGVVTAPMPAPVPKPRRVLISWERGSGGQVVSAAGYVSATGPVILPAHGYIELRSEWPTSQRISILNRRIVEIVYLGPDDDPRPLPGTREPR
ncbi:hypothetical protein GS432_19845 [Rhodococcus hoagii]|nr:hypothetical protein [Prescottella equi]